MDVMSWIVVALIILAAVVGYMRGFFNILLGFLKSLSSFVISFFLAKPFGNALFKLGLGNVISDKLETRVFTGKEIFETFISNDNKDIVIKNALSNLNIPSFLHNMITRIGNSLIGNVEGQTVGHFISMSLSNMCCIVIAFAILMLCSSLIFLLLRKFFKQITKVRFIRRVNRLFGLIVNTCFVLLIISLVFFGIAAITTVMPSFNEKVIELFGLNSNKFSIARWLYENNLIVKLFELFVK